MQYVMLFSGDGHQTITSEKSVFISFISSFVPFSLNFAGEFGPETNYQGINADKRNIMVHC